MNIDSNINDQSRRKLSKYLRLIYNQYLLIPEQQNAYMLNINDSYLPITEPNRWP